MVCYGIFWSGQFVSTSKARLLSFPEAAILLVSTKYHKRPLPVPLDKGNEGSEDELETQFL